MASKTTSVVVSRLRTLSNEIDGLIASFKDGKLEPSDEELKLLEEVSQKVSNDAPKVHAEAQALRKRRTKTVYEQGRKLLSMLDATHDNFKAGAKLTHRAAFIKSIQLLFNGLNVSKYDSTSIQARKRLTNDRCQRIRTLGPSGVVVWAATFVPSQWDANVLSKAVFDFVLEFFSFAGQPPWTQDIIEIARDLANEPPLKGSREYQRFLDEMSKSSECHSNSTHLSSQSRPYHGPTEERPRKRPHMMDEHGSQSPFKENREMQHMYTNAPAANISKLPEPFRTAIQNSRLWKWERSQNMETTGCWPSLFPKDNRQDVSFTIWCGNDDGYRLNDIFELKLAI